ncbi:MAG: DNA gyrase subunit A [Candidatus Nanopelagicales bacterium]
MARRRTPPPPPVAERIVDVDVSEEMRGSFLEYAYSVIYSRALPDARDGLKPVQRRILYQMAEMGLRPDRGHVKSARVVGDVMGRLHPHGDGAIYDALVRMAQPFTLRLPMVDGHGNFGSPDDGPAAMRYCVTGDTRVWLADGTRPRIDELVPDLAPDSEATVELKVQGKDGDPVLADRVFHSGLHPVLRVTTLARHTLAGTGNHPLLTLVDLGGVPTLLWRLLSELQPGDVVVRARHHHGSPEGGTAGSPATAEQVPLLAEFLRTAGSLPEMRDIAEALTDGRFAYETVVSVQPAGTAPVYSLRVVTEDHAFVTDGFVSHNTEARLAAPAIAMTASLDEDVVDFGANYDGREREPVVLPAAIPNLLVNGAAGIAVGMATNMAPHNLGEVVAAARHLLAHPEATLDDLMRFVPGPDLPTGGVVVGLDGIREAYESGRGSFRIRAATRIEQVTPRRRGIVVTELPWTVGPEKVIEKIKDLVQAKKLQGISDVIDLTDGEHGLRLVIEVKNGFHPEAVLAELYRLTPMEDAFNINNVALVDGQPQTLGLRPLLQVYVDHRLEVVRRRSLFRRTKAEDRLHLVDGLLIAILDIDEVIQLIRSSDDAAQARERLMTVFDLSEVQATYILDMPLRRLTKFSRIELEKERDELRRTIEELTAILDDEQRLRTVVSDELAEVARELGTPRRTVLLESVGAPATAAVPLEVADEPCLVLMSSAGLLARTTGDDPLPSGGARGRHDVLVSAVRATARGQVGLVTSAGRVHRLSVLDLPALPPTADSPHLSGGAPIGAFVDLPAGEQVLCLTGLDDGSPGLALGTERGVVKRVGADVPLQKDSWEVIRLDDGDRVVGAAELVTGEEDLVFVTSDAQLLRFPASSVRPQGRAAGGMAGVRLAGGARVVSFGAVAVDADSVTVTVAGASGSLPGTDAGSVKVTPLADYPAKGRGTGGVRCQRFLKGEDTLLLAWAGPGPARGASAGGMPVPLPEPEPRRDGSGTPLTEPLAAVGGPVVPSGRGPAAAAGAAADVEAGDIEAGDIDPDGRGAADV